MEKYLAKICPEPCILAKTLLIFCLWLPLTLLNSKGHLEWKPEAFLEFLTVPKFANSLSSFGDSRTWHNPLPCCLCKNSVLLAGLRSPPETSAHSRWDGLFPRQADSDIIVTCTDVWPSKTPKDTGISQIGSAQTGLNLCWTLLAAPTSSHSTYYIQPMILKYLISLPLPVTHGCLPLEQNKGIFWQF